MISGKIHSWESMGLVDGPGIRTVVFLQGCRLRCLYCHNPDTWAKEGGTLETVDEVMARLRRFRPYYGTEGGVTFSGGEPLLQREFLTEILSRCRQEGIHTCLDTAGCGAGGGETAAGETAAEEEETFDEELLSQWVVGGVTFMVPTGSRPQICIS